MGPTLLVDAVGMVSMCDGAVMFPFVSTATMVVPITQSVSKYFVFISSCLNVFDDWQLLLAAAGNS